MSNRFGTAVRRLAMACMVAGLGLASSASATLLDRGPDLVYDDVLNITWTRQAGDGVERTWPDANAWAANLVFAGFDDWRLPYVSVSAGVGPMTTVENCFAGTKQACRDDEIGYMYFYNLRGITQAGGRTAMGGQQLTGLQAEYWSGTGFDSDYAWSICFRCNGYQLSNFKGDENWAWAVRAGDVAAVPEPSSLLLIGVGMLGLVWMRSSRWRR